MTIKLRRYAALDGLRGIAALLVALLHTPFQSPMCDIALIRNGGLYVDFFFVLSGFVLTHAHVNKNDTFTSFFIKRTGRLWPLHIFLLAALIGLECFKLLMDRHGIPSDQAAFTEAHSWTSILSNIFLVQALGIYPYATWNGPSWSISTEMWVSMLFIAFILIARRRLGLVALIVAGASALLLSQVSPDMSEDVCKWAFFRCIYGFFSGVALYMLVGPSPSRISRNLEWPISFFVIVFIWLHQSGWNSLLAPPVFAVFIYIFSGEGGILSAGLKSRLCQWLGERSYSIYMTNAVVGTVLWRVAKTIGKLTGLQLNERTGIAERINFGHPWWMNVGTLFYLGIVLFLSAWTYAQIEVPWRKRFSQLAEKQRQRVTSVKPVPGG
jgi:peptidoglycan/LPS O-acetylase OafA/YrhL